MIHTNWLLNIQQLLQLNFNINDFSLNERFVATFRSYKRLKVSLCWANKDKFFITDQVKITNIMMILQMNISQIQLCIIFSKICIHTFDYEFSGTLQSLALDTKML